MNTAVEFHRSGLDCRSVKILRTRASNRSNFDEAGCPSFRPSGLQRFENYRIQIWDFEGKDVIVPDDEIVAGSTINEIFSRFRRLWVRAVRVACTHPSFSEGALDQLGAQLAKTSARSSALMQSRSVRGIEHSIA